MGTILPYVGDLDKIPKKWHLCDGMEGTPNLLDGHFLEGATNIKMFKEAGVPNVTGYFATETRMKAYISYSGAFKFSHFIGYGDSGETEQESFVYTFDASRCSPVYRNDISTVQPKSYTVLYIIKIKN